MATEPSRTDTVGNIEVKDRITRRILQRAAAAAVHMERLLAGKPVMPLVRKLYGEWCVITRNGVLAVTCQQHKTAIFWAQKMYGVPF